MRRAFLAALPSKKPESAQKSPIPELGEFKDEPCTVETEEENEEGLFKAKR